MRSGRLICLILGACLILSPSAAQAEGERIVLDIKTAIKKALALSPEVKQAQANLALARARQEEALAYHRPQIEATGLIGPTFKARGDQVYSPDTDPSIPRDLTFFTSLDVSLVQPLYTFGRLEESLKAARKGVEVEEAGIDLKEAEVIYRVKEAYYGLQLALEVKTFLDELEELLQKAVQTTKKLLEQESLSVSEIDLYKVAAFEGVLQGMKAQTENGLALAQFGLAAMCGLGQGRPWPKEPYLKPVQASLAALSQYQNEARVRRPEIRQLEAGLSALESLVKAAQAERMPLVFLGAILSAAWAPDRTDIDNPFIVDEFNHFYGGPVMGVRWSLNFGITEAKIDQAEAERMKVKALELTAEMYLPVEVAQAYLAVKEAEELMSATKKAYTSARRWMVAASANYDLGVGEARDLLEALTMYATQRGEYFKAVHKLNLSWAKLLKVTGLDGAEVG